MSDDVGIESREPKIGCLVHETPIFGPKQKMTAQGEISATSIYEDTLSLSLDPRHKAVCSPCWIKDKRTSFSQHVWVDSPAGRMWQVYDQAAGCLMHIGLNPKCANRKRVLLRVAVEAELPSAASHRLKW